MKVLTKQEVKARFEEIFGIGSGTFGKVVKAFDKELKKLVAIKILINNGKESKEAFEKEAKNIEQLSSKNCIKIYDSFYVEDDQMYIVMEYCGMGNISQYKRMMNNDILSIIARECAKALVEIHEKRMIHLDVKPQNILLTTSGDIKLCDFGIMRKVDDGIEIINTAKRALQKEGTELYMSPEILKTQSTEDPISYGTDIYSLGMSLFEMVSGVPLGLTNNEEVDEWFDDNDYSFACSTIDGDKRISKRNAKMIFQMLSEKPKNRPSAKDIVNAFSDLPPSWIILKTLTTKPQSDFWE